MLGNEMCSWTPTEPPVASYPTVGTGFDYEDQFNINGTTAQAAYSVQSPFDLAVQGQEVPQYYSEAYESRLTNHSASQRVSVIGNYIHPLYYNDYSHSNQFS